MTAEQFSTEYHLLNSVSTGAIETYHAHAATGAMVMVHFLRGSQPENDEIVDLLARQNADRRKKIMRTVEVDGVTAVVTRFILDISTFREWLLEGVGTDTVQPVSPPVAPPVAPPPAVAPPVSAAPAHTPGEITRMFMAASGDAPVPAPPATVTPPAPAPIVAQSRPEPGEFTRMFSTVQPDVAPPPPPPPVEAVRAPDPAPPMFPPPAELPQLRVPEPVLDFGPITPKQPEPPGSYTRMFAAADYASSPPPPAAPALPAVPKADPPLLQTHDAYVDRLYRIEPPAPTPPPPTAGYAEPAPFAAYGAGEPSEFTRVIASFAPPPAAAAPVPMPAPAAAPPPAAKSNSKGYIIAAAAVLALAVIVIIVAVVISRASN